MKQTGLILLMLLAVSGCAAILDLPSDLMDFVLSRDARERVDVRYAEWRDAGEQLVITLRDEIDNEAIANAVAALILPQLGDLSDRLRDLLDRLATMTPEQAERYLARLEQQLPPVAAVQRE